MTRAVTIAILTTTLILAIGGAIGCDSSTKYDSGGGAMTVQQTQSGDNSSGSHNPTMVPPPKEE